MNFVLFLIMEDDQSFERNLYILGLKNYSITVYINIFLSCY